MTTLSIQDWASAISALMAAVAAIFSAYAIYTNRKSSREQRAADSLKRFLELALQHPTLSTVTKEDEFFWFNSFMFMMVQDVLTAHKSDKNWEKLMEYQLGLFRKDLVAWKDYDAKQKTNSLKKFGPDVERLVNKVLSKKTTT